MIRKRYSPKQTRVKCSFVNCFLPLCGATTAVDYGLISFGDTEQTHRSVPSVSKTSALTVLVKTTLVIKRVAYAIFKPLYLLFRIPNVAVDWIYSSFVFRRFRVQTLAGRRAILTDYFSDCFSPSTNMPD